MPKTPDSRKASTESLKIGAPTNFKRGIGDQQPGQTNNLTDLENLTEDTLLLELTVRYKDDVIYTYVGDILCAINPFKTIPDLYSSAKAKQYAGLTSLADLPPHIFASADAAFTNMVSASSAANANQVCVISGESGAGKTESAKLFIKHIISLSNKAVRSGDEKALEDKIVDLNPLMEGFGNAQTLMNDNSSRFGKFIELRFNSERTITGAIVREYLLEKSRVIQQTDGEQNFHVFYLFFAGMAERKEEFGLADPMEHRILNNNEQAVDNIESKKIRDMWEEFVGCFKEVGFEADAITTIYHMLAGICHLGDVEFGGIVYVGNQDPAYVVSTEDVLRKVADQFGVDIDTLQSALVSLTMTTRGESVTKQYNQIEAEDCRDALAKTVYNRMFSWIVKSCNSLLGPKTKSYDYTTIGILDIFGFEVFDDNSFEQLLINLANEQLQFFFNNHIFSLELAEYAKEGIEASAIEFSDNQDLLNMLLGKPIGLLALCDEEAKVPRGTDKSMLEKLHHNLESRNAYSRPKGDADNFTIAHYAGKVTYNSIGFLDKNRDTVAIDLIAVMRLSSRPLVVDLFGGTSDKKGKSRKGGGRNDRKKELRQSVKRVKKDMDKENRLTVGASFKFSLAELMEEMNRAQPHFIRCIKPNLDKKPDLFKLEMVTKQLRYTGMLETTRIRKEGYSHRPLFKDFIDRFKAIAFPLNSSPAANAQNCVAILSRAKLEDWQVGKTKVFLRYYHMGQLGEALRPYPTAAAQIQAAVRYFTAKTTFDALKEQKAKQDAAINKFLTAITKGINAKVAVLEVLAEEDAMRPPNFFEEKKKQVKIQQDPTVKKMQKQANKKGISRAQSVKWFKEVEMKKGAGQDDDGFEIWFHGIITRNEANDLLLTKEPGAFLVRVSESRFGYSLSHYVTEGGRIKHYMLDVLPDGQYQVVGNKKLFPSLNELVRYHRSHKIVATDPVPLIEPCGQAEGEDNLQESGLR